jgi:hypothetical protein
MEAVTDFKFLASKKESELPTAVTIVRSDEDVS